MSLYAQRYKTYPETFQFSKVTTFTPENGLNTVSESGSIYYKNGYIYVEIGDSISNSYLLRGKGEFVKYDQVSDAYKFKAYKYGLVFWYEVYKEGMIVGYHLELFEDIYQDFHR